MNTNKRLDEIRSERAKLCDERERVERAPLDLATISRDRLAPWLDAASAAFRPDVRRAVDPRCDVDARLISLTGHHPAEPVTERELVGVLAVLCRRDLEKLLLASIRAELDGRPAGLPPAERVAQIAELDCQLAKLERDEERLVRTLERDGVDVDRRADADPVVVLARDEELAA